METSTPLNLDLPSYERIYCSPEINRDFVGLLISAPKEIDFNEEKRIPICGGFRLSNTVTNVLGNNLIEETVLVFINKDTGNVFSFNLAPDKDMLDGGLKNIVENSAELSIDKMVKIETTMVLSYFNIDAIMFKQNFPEDAATYIVYATQRHLKSNIIEIQVLN
jgi:hypothetical protein